ncbi:actin nucleation-promoting factor WASL isoform X2 [Dicentrarchus labrax]|uniref:actin nucleation-promoting factor WASL isoform X2 n=1 Tax=Dicentrarchus labrax TaxID=13489 RepID=UPI0021F5793D|nr:actin nucleation-promoting factor WASL isoform X2 [Dicentrarchus labrax]
MASSLIPGCIVMSDLLTIREKGVLYSLLEPQCKLIKTTVGQVLVAKEMQHESPGWSCLGCGTVCLVEDESIHSYFLRLYCVKRAKLLWEQEMYIPFKYAATRRFFHTFPADGHQVGLNFANVTEAEEFHLAVEAVQRNQEKTTRMTEITNAERYSSTSDKSPYSRMNTLDHLHGEQHFPMDAPSTEVTPTTSIARLTEEDLLDKDVAEAVDCIINQFGGLKAVQRELRNKGPISQTLPRAAGASISLSLRKGPLPPVPSIKGSTSFQQTPQYKSPTTPWIPSPTSTHAPVVPERIRKSSSFKQVGFPVATEKRDLILTALKDVLRQKQINADGGQH